MEDLVREVMAAAEPEAVIRAHLEAFIAHAGTPEAAGEHWAPGQPLRLLLIGYAGVGNTGADVRTAEMIRQIRALLGGNDAVTFGVVCGDRHLPAALFPDVTVEPAETYFPAFLLQTLHRYHGALACEGSTFKSNFSDTLSMMMAGGLGMAAAAGKPAIAYGAGAGTMSAELAAFVTRTCAGALLACRDGDSQRRLDALALRTAAGADTAWTFDPAPPERADALLAAAGRDDGRPVVAVCPVNPFWWPVRFDFAKLQALQQTGAFAEWHYGAGLFHNDSADGLAAYNRYLDALAAAVSDYCRERGALPVIVGMDRVDRPACTALAGRLAGGAPVLASGDRTAGELVAVLRRSSLLVSSRFHGIVTAMPAGVPAVGVSLDERIGTLLGDAADRDRVIPADAPDLADRLTTAMRAADAEREAIAARNRQITAREVKAMGAMGETLLAELRRVLPALPVPDRPAGWAHHLPPLPPLIAAILSDHG